MEIELSARLIFGISALLLMAGIFQMIRKGLIMEKHSLLWIPMGISFLIFGIFPSLLLWISEKIHLHYITVVLLCVILFFTYILLYFNIKLSQLMQDVKALAQELVIIRGSESFNDKRDNENAQGGKIRDNR